MTATEGLQFGLDDLDEAALLGLETLPVQVLGPRDQKPLPPFGLRVVVPPVQVADVVGSIGVYRGTSRARSSYAQHEMIASLLLEAVLTPSSSLLYAARKGGSISMPITSSV